MESIATATVLASSTATLNEVPEWMSYIVDIILIVIFLFILFFVKPQKDAEVELTDEEKPNPLEQVLQTDMEDEKNTESKSSDNLESNTDTEQASKNDLGNTSQEIKTNSTEKESE